MYEMQSRIRYSEVDEEQRLTIQAIINYFQDCSTFQSEDLGVGIDSLGNKNRAWLLSSWQIIIEKQPMFGQEIGVQTWPYGFRGFYGMRNFQLVDSQREPMVKANSVWFYMDTNQGRPVKVGPEEEKAYQLEEPMDMAYADRKIKIPEESVAMPPITVLKYQLDTNHHVNNGQYVQMAYEFLPEGFSLYQLRVEYKKAAVLHDVVIPRVHTQLGLCVVSLCDEKGKPYAIVEFQEKK